VGWLALSPTELKLDKLIVIPMPADPAAYATGLYSGLFRLDEAGVERIIVSMPPDTDEWLAVRDRLMRASRPPV
jgi:hypothetical protein